MLAVVAFIAILCALLLPALLRAKSSAKARQCQSNLRQMGVALHVFVADQKAYPLAANAKYFEGKHPEPEVRAPADMMALGDGFRGWNTTVVDGSPSFERDKGVILGADHGGTQRAMRRHSGKANVVLCDGHVESVSLHSLFTDSNDDVLRRWNKDNQPHREKLQ